MKKRTFSIISILIFITAIAMLTSIAVPLIVNYNNPENFKEYIDSLGSWGFVIMFFMQLAQIIVAFIPGEAVEFVAGALYGWFWGLIFCCVGIILGQFIIFCAVKFLGRDFAEKVAGSKIMNKYEFLHNEKKLKSIIFILFFLPGTPKDLLTYFIPLTSINIKEFLIITTLARIPSVLSSTYAGSVFSEQNHFLLLAVYAGILLFTLIGVITFKIAFKTKKSQ